MVLASGNRTEQLSIYCIWLRIWCNVAGNRLFHHLLGHQEGRLDMKTEGLVGTDRKSDGWRWICGGCGQRFQTSRGMMVHYSRRGGEKHMRQANWTKVLDAKREAKQ